MNLHILLSIQEGGIRSISVLVYFDLKKISFPYITACSNLFRFQENTFCLSLTHLLKETVQTDLRT